MNKLFLKGCFSLMVLLFCSTYSPLLGQTKLFLQKKNQPSKRKEVAMAIFKIHTYSGQFYELENPPIFDNAIVIEGTTIPLSEIADIQCAVRAPKGTPIGMAMMAGGTVGIFGSFVLYDSDGTLSNSEMEQATYNLIASVMANSAMIVAGYLISGLPRKYNLRYGPWQLVAE